MEDKEIRQKLLEIFGKKVMFNKDFDNYVTKLKEGMLNEFIEWCKRCKENKELGFVSDTLWKEYLEYQSKPKPFPPEKERKDWYGLLKEALERKNALNKNCKIKDLKTLLSKELDSSNLYSRSKRLVRTYKALFTILIVLK